jgi:hypothetical protein
MADTDRMGGIPTIEGEEFRELGYLQEANRRFFHPLGLAMFIDQGWTRERVQEFLTSKGVQFGEEATDHIMTFLSRAGMLQEHIGGVLDDREDEQGFRYAVREDHLEEDLAEFTRKRISVEGEWLKRAIVRVAELGYVVQEDIHVPGLEIFTHTSMPDDDQSEPIHPHVTVEEEEAGDVEGYT